MGEVVASAGVIVPASPVDRQKLKAQLTECVNCLQRISSEREAMKDIIKAITENFDIPKNVAGKLARTMYKSDFAKVRAEHDDFETLYETIVEGAKNKQ